MLDGQVALVTGASRGIGRAVADELGKAGAYVAGTATSEAGAQAIGLHMRAAGYKGDGYCLDVCDAQSVQSIIQAIESECDAPVGILINNAGVTRDNLSLRMKQEDWEAVLETNLQAVFRLCQTVMRGMMKSRGGRIINITSVVAHSGNAGQANYCAAKAGVEGLSRALARELGGRNITVNCVAPGLIDTDMTRKLDDEQRRQMLSNIPLARLGQPEDVAQAVLFLASPGASYISGTTLHVNGGMLMN